MEMRRPGAPMEGEVGPTPRRHTRWWTAAAVLLGGAALLWTLRSEPLHSTVATAPAAPENVPGRSPFPFGSGPPVTGAPSRNSRTRRETRCPRRCSSHITMQRNGSPARSRLPILAACSRGMYAGLPSVLRTGAIDAGDALVLKADLLDVLELDPMRRRDRLLEWWSAHPLPGRAPDPRNPPAAEDLRREQAAVAEWQAQRSEDRDAGELEEKLEALDMRSGRR